VVLLDFAPPTGEAHRAGGIPLGIIEFDDCEQFDVALDVGDLVLVYTDSLIEAEETDSRDAGARRLPLS